MTIDIKRRFNFIVYLSAENVGVGTVELTQGDAFLMKFRIRDARNQLVDLTGVTGSFKLSKKHSFTEEFEKTTSDGITVSGSNIEVAVSGEDLPDFGEYFAQLRISSGGQDVVIASCLINVIARIE